MGEGVRFGGSLDPIDLGRRLRRGGDGPGVIDPTSGRGDLAWIGYRQLRHVEEAVSLNGDVDVAMSRLFFHEQK